jgi:aldehyde dehydrogenase
MQLNETVIRNVVEEVLSRLGANGSAAPAAGNGQQGRHGLFTDPRQAVAAARDAFEQLSTRTLEDRKRIIDHIRRIAIDQCVELGTMEMDETKIGRLAHKIEKLKTLGERAPGVEFMRSEVFSGDHGLAVIEHAPFGVIGAVTPVTHSLPTLTGNAVSMIAAGNTLVVNPHPSGKRVAAEGVRRYNEAIYRDLGIDNLITIIVETSTCSASPAGRPWPGPPCSRPSGPSSPDRAIRRWSSTKRPTWTAPPSASSRVAPMTITCCASPKRKCLSSSGCSTT